MVSFQEQGRQLLGTSMLQDSVDEGMLLGAGCK